MNDGDDLDQLVRSSTAAPPAHLAAVLRRRADFEQHSGRIALLLAADLVAFAVLIVISMAVGAAIRDSGAGSLLSMAAGDAGIVRAAPADFLSAVLQSLPWPLLALLALDLLVVLLLTSSLLHLADRFHHPEAPMR